MVTACSTITWACANLVGSPDPMQCATATSNCAFAYGGGSIDVDADGWLTSFASAFDQLPDTDKGSENAPEWAVYECTLCGLDTVSKLPIDESIPAEAMGDPWVLPQPATLPCPMCVIDDDEIYLSIDEEYADMDLENLTIELYDEFGAAEFISYGRLSLSPTVVLVVTDPEVQTVDRSGLPPEKANVTMVFTDNNAPTGPMTIVAGNELPIY
jgi:hypothetical protein